MGHLAGKDGTKTHGLLRVIITANRHILSPGQVWGWQPLIITHPKTSACPAVLLCSAWSPAFHPAGLLAAWAAGPTGWEFISLLQNGGRLCRPEKAWGELAPGLCPVRWDWQRSCWCCWLSRPSRGRRLRAFPWWAVGLEQGMPAFCYFHPAWCQLLQKAGTTCFHVNSALGSRGLSKINLEIALPLALTEGRPPFPSLRFSFAE